MVNEFGEIYLELTKKEKAAVLYSVRMCTDTKYPNLHAGQIPFLTCDVIHESIRQQLTSALVHELKPKIKRKQVRIGSPSSKICESIIAKLTVTYKQEVIYLDEAKVKSQIRTFIGTEYFVTRVPVCDGRLTAQVKLKLHDKKNMFMVSTKKSFLKEAIQQLTYKYGVWN